jgi:hypothetical protein
MACTCSGEACWFKTKRAEVPFVLAQAAANPALGQCPQVFARPCARDRLALGPKLGELRACGFDTHRTVPVVIASAMARDRPVLLESRDGQRDVAGCGLAVHPGRAVAQPLEDGLGSAARDALERVGRQREGERVAHRGACVLETIQRSTEPNSSFSGEA